MTTLYGFQTELTDGLAKAVAAALATNFETRHSDFRGGDYYSFDCVDHQVILQANRDLGDLAEEEFAAWAALLYIEGPAPKALGQRLTNCIPTPVLLRSRPI